MARFGNFLQLEPLTLEELPTVGKLESVEVSQSKSKHKRPLEESQGGGDDTAALRAPSNATEIVRSEASPVDGRPALRPFVKEVLDQAVTFMDEIFPFSFTAFAEKTSPPSTAKVQLLKRDRNPPRFTKIPWGISKFPRDTPHNLDSMGEGWFARRSRHANRQEKGTACFSECDYGLRVDHCEHEGQYTPEIFDTYKVLDWRLQQESPGEDRPTSEEDVNFGDYKDVSMSSRYPVTFSAGLRLLTHTVFEMCHKLPPPLSIRVFPVVVVTARTGKNAFIIVQRPVDIKSLPEAFYSNGRNLQEGDSDLKRKSPVLGSVKHGCAPVTVLVF